jgi:hypothetical protein
MAFAGGELTSRKVGGFTRRFFRFTSGQECCAGGHHTAHDAEKCASLADSAAVMPLPGKHPNTGPRLVYGQQVAADGKRHCAVMFPNGGGEEVACCAEGHDDEALAWECAERHERGTYEEHR